MITTDNLRKFRRYLQGRGVNVRKALVDGANGSGSPVRVAIPNLKDDDAITSFIDLTTPADASAAIAMEKNANVSVFATTKGVKYTSRLPGVAGPGATEVRIKYTDTNVADDPLVVTVENQAGGIVLIDVQLEQNSSAVIVTTAAEARAAVLQNQDAAKIVDAALVGDGTTVLTATGPHKLGATPGGDVSASVVGYLRRQGATPASLTVDIPYVDGDALRFEAVVPGAFGVGKQGGTLPIRIQYVDGSNPAETTVVVEDGPYFRDVAVTLRETAGVILATGDEVVAAVKASADASALVTATRIHGGPGEGAPGVVAAFAATELTGGEDSGVHVSTDLSSKKVLVEWVSRA